MIPCGGSQGKFKQEIEAVFGIKKGGDQLSEVIEETRRKWKASSIVSLRGDFLKY
jgi:hypothetical protein